MKHGFSWSSHTHSEGQSIEKDVVLGVLIKNGVVALHTNIVGDITRLGRTNNGIQEKLLKGERKLLSLFSQ